MSTTSDVLRTVIKFGVYFYKIYVIVCVCMPHKCIRHNVFIDLTLTDTPCFLILFFYYLITDEIRKNKNILRDIKFFGFLFPKDPIHITYKNKFFNVYYIRWKKDGPCLMRLCSGCACNTVYIINNNYK